MLSPTAPSWAGGGTRLGLLGTKPDRTDSGGLTSDTSFPELGAQTQGPPKLTVKKRISIQRVVIPQSTSQNQQQQQQPVPREFGTTTNSHPTVITNTSTGSEKSWCKKFSPVSPELASKIKTNTSNTRPMTSKSGCVAFQHETDGRSTYPNQKDFHDFCKQRDLFYGIKEIWTTQRSHPLRHKSTSTYDPAFSRIKQLFQLNSTPTNLNRLAMLFLSQCILDSVFCGSQAGKAEGSSGNVARLNPENRKAENTVRQFLQSNPSRLELLRNRVAPNPAVSEVDFIQINDPMAFLKYFIGTTFRTSVPTFTQFLIDQAIHELTQIEATLDTEGPPTDPKEILDLIQKSVLLGKMLGFLYYLPYSQSPNSKYNNTSVEQQALLRAHQVPPLDIYRAIIKAFKQNRLIMTLPWVLELLAQADPVVQHLPKYKPCVQLISFLYRKCFCDNSGTSTPENIKYLTMVGTNRQFLRLYVENLVGPYISSIDDVLSETSLSELEITLDLGARISTGADIGDSNEINIENVDSQGFIGSTLIPLRFSSDQQIEKTFQTNNEDFPPLVPSAAEQVVPESPFPDRVLHIVDTLKLKQNTIQDMLEAQFYKMHPESLKKTIEFVAERNASNFIKNVRNFLLPQIKQDLATRGISKHKAVAEVKTKIKALQTDFCTDRCRKSLEYLLDESLSSGVKATSCSIAITKAEGKITYWVGQHVTPDKFPVIKIVDSIPVPVKTDPASQKTTKVAKEDKHEPSSGQGEGLYAFECMILLQRLLRKLHNGQLVDLAVIDQITKNLHKIYNYKPWTRNSVMNLVTALMTYQPKDFNDRLQAEFVQAFKTLGWNKDEDPSKLLSARNVILFAQSKSPEETWKLFGSFLVTLLRNKLLNVKTLEKFCLVLLRQDWSPEIIGRIHKLLTLLKHESGGQGLSEADELMSWTEWVYSGREDESF